MEQKRKNKKPLSIKKIRLNELGYEWVKLAEEGNEAAYNAKWYEIWQILFDVYYPYLKTEAQFIAFEKTITETKEKYNGASPLAAFFSSRLRFRTIDEDNKEKENPFERISDVFESDDGETKDNEIGITDHHFRDIEGELAAAFAFYEIASVIIDFKKKDDAPKSKKFYNKEKRNYFRLFFTVSIMNFIHLSREEPPFQHRRDITRAMKGRFVNYCMVNECRNLSDIFYGDLKMLGEVVDDAGKKADKPIDIPIPNSVGICYLGRIENNNIAESTYSDQKRDFKAMVKKLLLSNDIVERIMK